MNNKFDELTKGMAQSITRRSALKKFGLGLAGMVLACLGLANKADAATPAECRALCTSTCSSYPAGSASYNSCYRTCYIKCFMAHRQFP